MIYLRKTRDSGKKTKEKKRNLATDFPGQKALPGLESAEDKTRTLHG